jgi:hypothetical protein
MKWRKVNSNLKSMTNRELRIRTRGGIAIDLKAERVNTFDSIRVNSESISNKIDASGSQFEKAF